MCSSVLVSGQEEWSSNQPAFEILQQRGEVYFSFKTDKPVEIDFITQILSIDKLVDGRIWAYANREGFENFLTLNIDYRTEIAPSLRGDARMYSEFNSKENYDWDAYPTFEMYQQMMYDFAANYPAICTVEKIGESVEGKDILVLKISDAVELDESEPEFLYTSTIHGDETTGYVLLLRLADYLLSNYGADPRITSIVNNMEIWINPLANPDGTYWMGTSTVNGAIRFNANQIDLNRNFPDPLGGLHPDGNPWQSENVVMMNFMNQHHFIMSCNMHGGTEVMNYPWDTMEKRHADDDWYYYTSREYVDTVHANKPSNWGGYFSFQDNGITNGYDWYTIDGGRQDYVNYYLGMREVTLELSNIKTPQANLLPAYWDTHYSSLLNYLEQAQYGIRGFVSDAITGEPLKAKIEIIGHDFDNSHIHSSELHGEYYRLLAEGTYELQFSAKGYATETRNNVVVINHQAVFLDVALDTSSITGIEDQNLILLKIYPNPASDYVLISHGDKSIRTLTLSLLDELGREIRKKNIENPDELIELSIQNLSPGLYFIRLRSVNKTGLSKLIIH